MSADEKRHLLVKINDALNDVRPHLKVDGGNVEVVDVSEEMDVQIKWVGSCEWCTMSDMTLRAGVEQTLKSRFPEINSVIAVNGVHRSS